MVRLTVRDFLQGKADKVAISGIYVVRDEECVLYVGRSKDVVTRLYNHIEKWASHQLGDVIRINAPQSLSWQIELMEPEECRDIVKSIGYQRYEDTELTIDIELAEQSLIMHYHPCLNISNNVNPGRLHPHIKRYSVELEGGITDDLY
jgi:predicted GIY-YIG superfamily endonuclease